MTGSIPVSVHSKIDPILDDTAELFVAVELSYHGEYWWRTVRQQGKPAALKLLDKNWYVVAAACEGQQLVGFAGLDEVHNGETEIIRIMTHPDHTGKGIATKCIQALLDVADQNDITVWLDVLDHEMRAIEIYQRLGFVQFDNKPGEHSKRPAIQMRRLHPTAQSLRDRLTFTPFVDATDENLHQLADALNTPGVTEFMLGGGPHEMVRTRQQRDRNNQILHCVVSLDNQPVGWCGWARFELNPNQIEPTTFLAEHTWGTGINTQLKHLQHQVVALSGHPFVFAINEHNTRSIAAVRKTYSDLIEQRVWEPGATRHSIILTPTTTPEHYVPWPHHIAEPLAATVKNLGLPYTLTR